MTRFVDGLYDRWYRISDWFYYDVPRRWKTVGLMAVVVVLCGTAFWLLRPGDSSELGSIDGSSPDSTSSADGALATIDARDEVRSETSAADSIQNAVSTSSTATTTATTSSSTSVPATTTTAVPEPQVASEPPLGYPTGPDGLPLPVVVLFDVDTITISGQVPSQAAKDRLASLAVANSQFPDAQVIDNMVINPAVPISVGVRVIELNSVRFPEASAEILPEHALELDRVVNIMKALPNISVLVVGHADQRGDDVTNFAISDERARAVVNYLLYLGIPPTRYSSRAAGESDLLADAEDPLSLALNRRTEFIFYGLLIE
jgi:outer membrane protein OmpA-like peptidoglycan-associated protein